MSRAQLTYRETLSNQLQSSVLAAMATMRQFADQPGRKVMLVLAGGWPRSVEIYTRERLPAGGFPLDRRVMSEDDIYGPLVSTANLIGFSLYRWTCQAARGTSRATRREGSAPLTARARRRVRSTSSICNCARSTGGVPMINAHRDAALARVVADTRSYYWLGFEATARGRCVP